ncbi:8-amino-7-oxononanoate synthase [Cladophialophora carrionii]|uniref:8-amino-7-oxononanoate synthase n=1 Tax=Cladophialophora carrionii TaxID=86049 RepID=A0A1C1CE96_9EURO|nr:8-amino-7-oxononanoate synthase [Cladophialophora carrionii]
MSPSPLERRLSGLLEKRRAQSKLRNLKSSPPGSVDFSSNDFLSLSSNKEFQDDYLALLSKGRTPLGSTGSRLLDGNSELAESLEREIAAFHGAEAGLLTNSGFDANVSIFAFLPQQGDVIIYDELIHASVHDGMRQCRAKQQIPFKHNDVEDLSRILQQFSSSSPNQTIFVALETVYSMEGDLAPLTEIVDLVEAILPHNNAHLVVDEAHATGIYGPNGSGRVCELGLEKRVSIRLHTFGKALASNGAIILSSPIIRLYLINYARPLIYTTFMSHPNLLAIKNAYDWLRVGKANFLAANLYHLIDHLYARLQSLTALASSIADPTGKPVVTLPTTCPESPIFAILSPQPRSLASHCQSAGFIVRPVVAPTVPAGTERVRVCLHAGNTVAQIDKFVECLKRWITNQGAINQAGMDYPAEQYGRAGEETSERRLLAKI